MSLKYIRCHCRDNAPIELLTLPTSLTAEHGSFDESDQKVNHELSGDDAFSPTMYSASPPVSPGKKPKRTSGGQKRRRSVVSMALGDEMLEDSESEKV